MTTSPQILAVAGNYAGLVQAIRACRIDKGMSQLELDERAGLPSGYTAKIEISATKPNSPSARSIGKESLPLLLGALDIELAVIPADRSGGSTPKSDSSFRGLMADRQKKMRDLAAAGGRKSWRLLTEKERAKRIDRMNRARIAKQRAKRRAKRGKARTAT